MVDFTPVQSITLQVVTICAVIFVCADLIITAGIEKKKRRKQH